MTLLLDTHAFLWWVDDAQGLSPRARRAIGKAGNECLVSLASIWEIALKSSLKKLRLGAPIERFVPEQMAANGFGMLGIEFDDVTLVESMPFHHRDPFDRLLVAQALRNALVVVSRDRSFDRYGVERLW
jgi:PIN domain nuclease of toxin-antitoxin system